MTSRDDLRRHVIELGQAPIEPVAPRMGALEERLLAAIDDEDDSITPFALTGAVVGRATPRNRRRGLAAAAAVVLVVTVGALLVSPTDDRLVIAAAERVEVVLPDGTTVDGVVGVELPDGSLVDVDGSLTVDGRRFAPGDYRVVDGELVRLPTSAPAGQDGRGVVATDATIPDTSEAVGDRTVPTASRPDDDDVEPDGDVLVRTTVVDVEPAPSDAGPTRTTSPTSSVEPARPPSPVATTSPERTTEPERTTTTSPVRTTQAERTTVAPQRTTAPATTAPVTRPSTVAPATTTRPQRAPVRPTTTAPR
ncbi:MAG: hypothetical protein AB8G26_03520 [Ilumatobacter sp.]